MLLIEAAPALAGAVHDYLDEGGVALFDELPCRFRFMASVDAVCDLRRGEYLDNAVCGVLVFGSGTFVGGALQELAVLAVGGRTHYDDDKIQKESKKSLKIPTKCV